MKARLRGAAVVIASAALVAGCVFAPVPAPAGAVAGGPESLNGSWAFALSVDAWGVPDENIGTFVLGVDGSCEIRIRVTFGGFMQDQRSTTCVWTTDGSVPPAVDGEITATGITPTPLVLSFVITSGGARLLLLFDETPPGAVGTGMATRR